MGAKVSVHMGDVFEGKADLTVLPCGAKRGWTASVGRSIENYKLPTPEDLSDDMNLSDVTRLVPFPGDRSITKFVAYGASVLNGNTHPEAIRKLGANIGAITRRHSEIKIVESVLFGTGHGGMADEPAAKALAKGFKETADPGAELWIWVHGATRHAAVQKAIKESNLISRFVDSLVLSPVCMGFGIDLKKLLKK
jgi:hypothetical protein